jgi:hypothetical protein
MAIADIRPRWPVASGAHAIAAGVQGDRGVVSAQHGCRICCEHILLDMQGMQMMTLLSA